MSTINPESAVERLAFRPSEAAAATGLSRSRIYELMAAGTLAYRQIGSVRLIPRQALEALLTGDPNEVA